MKKAIMTMDDIIYQDHGKRNDSISYDAQLKPQQVDQRIFQPSAPVIKLKVESQASATTVTSIAKPLTVKVSHPLLSLDKKIKGSK